MSTTEDASRMRRAVVVGDLETVRVLLDAGVPVDSPCDRGYTALHHAAWYGRTEILRLLLRYGAEVEVANRSGATPLFYGVSRKHADAVRILLEHGARVDPLSEAGCCPLLASSANPEIGKLLLGAGASVSTMTASGLTVLAKSLIVGNAETARFWAEHHAPLHLPNDNFFRGILRIRVGNDPEKAAVVREFAPDVSRELFSGVEER